MCQTDRLISAPYDAVVANIYVGQKLSVVGMYEKGGTNYYLVGLQGEQDTSAFFSEKTGKLEPEIYVELGGRRIFPTIKPNNVVLKLYGCKE